MAMRLMGEQFVTGETISEALANARKLEDKGFRYSYDMLGEAALTEADAQAYLLFTNRQFMPLVKPQMAVVFTKARGFQSNFPPYTPVIAVRNMSE